MSDRSYVRITCAKRDVDTVSEAVFEGTAESENDRPDLGPGIVDIGDPEIVGGGYDMLRELSEKHPDIPFLATSGGYPSAYNPFLTAHVAGDLVETQADDDGAAIVRVGETGEPDAETLDASRRYAEVAARALAAIKSRAES